MQSIFDREYRREKQLENQRRLESQAKAPSKKQVDPEKIQREKDEKMAAKLEEQRELFFKQVSEGEDITAIRARGEAFDKQPDESKQMGSSIKIEKVNLEEGKNYAFEINGQGVPFTLEMGGIIAGDQIAGAINDGKVMFTYQETAFEGNFTSSTNVDMNFKSGQGGDEGQLNVTLKMI